MKIAIQTLPLNTNYGGILQAFALQSVLESMGHDVCVIDKRAELPKPTLLKSITYFMRKSVKRYLCGDKSAQLSPRKQYRYDYPVISQHTEQFIDRYINRHKCEKYSDLKANFVEAIVVGSDQVWRPRYFGNIEDAFLGFASEWNISRVSYAASFGTDKWEYSEGEMQRCRALMARFDSVSVREDSAVDLCREYLGVEAEHNVDPTMLLKREDYERLVENSAVPKSAGNLMVYVLDNTVEKQTAVAAVAAAKNLKPFAAKSEGGRELSKRIEPPVEEWLRGFIDAEFVVSDSFHACVFSIIFNKPFVVFGNKERGISRFESLLKMFGLEDRLVFSSKDIETIISKEIDWQSVNSILEAQQQKSADYLKKL